MLRYLFFSQYQWLLGNSPGGRGVEGFSQLFPSAVMSGIIQCAHQYVRNLKNISENNFQFITKKVNIILCAHKERISQPLDSRLSNYVNIYVYRVRSYSINHADFQTNNSFSCNRILGHQTIVYIECSSSSDEKTLLLARLNREPLADVPSRQPEMETSRNTGSC